MSSINESDEYFNALKNMKGKMSFIIEENEELKANIKELEYELNNLRVINANVVEHSSTIENELEDKLEQLTHHRPTIVPEYSRVEELRTKLSLEIDKNEHFKLQNQILLEQLDQLRFLYVSTMEHSSTLENELNDKYREASRLSITDNLTGIYNRDGCRKNWEVEVDRVKRQGGTFSLVMFDIDFFKNVNDNYGHDAGDLVLIKIVQIIQNSIRKGDIYSRWGGDEFLIIFPGMPTKEVIELTERLRDNVEKEIFPGPEKVTCSFGLTEYIKNDSLEDMLNRVDLALYSAKRKGRNCVETSD